MALPSSITAITVSGQYVTPDGSAASGKVSFTPSVAAAADGVVLPVAPYVVELDSDGSFSVELGATDDPNWSASGFTYLVTERIDGARVRSYSIEVPADSPDGTLDLATVAPVVAADSVTPYLLAANNLDDVADVAIARTNLGLGNAATRNVGTTTGTVAHGDHTHGETSQAVTMGTNVQGWPTVGTAPTAYKDANNWVRLDGGIESTGTIGAGATLATLPSGYRPASNRQFTMRHTVTSASTGTVSVNASSGVVTYNSGFNSGAIMDFTGIQFKAA